MGAVGRGSGLVRMITPRSMAGGPSAPSMRTSRRGPATSGLAVPWNLGDRCHDHGIARSRTPDRRETESHRSLAGEDGDRVEPQGDVVVGRRDEVGYRGLGRPPAARQHGERSGMARRRVAAGRLPRMRPSPVDRFVGTMADRLERQEAPADDPVDDLEAALDLDRAAPTVGADHLVGRQGLAGRKDPADRHAG